MEELRHRIDGADREIQSALAHRMVLVEEAGEHKRDHNMAIFEVERWNEVFRSRGDWGAALGLD